MNKPYNNISILGCGWLGLPLANHLIGKSFSVKGSTMHHHKLIELKKNGITPYRIELSPELNSDFDKEFFNSQILIINIPPKRREDIMDFHPLQIESLIKQIKTSPIKQVLFVSSTSVYPNLNGIVTEKDTLPATKPSGMALQKVEQMLQDCSHFQTTILRFGGLIGYDRHPGRFLSGGRNLKDGTAPVNLIHRDDCIGIISTIIEHSHWGEIFNGCSPEHPTRKEFYEKAALLGGFKLPEFINNPQSYKIVSPKKLIIKTNYKFKFNNPMQCL